MSSFIPAAEYVADTVALVLHLEKRKSGATAKLLNLKLIMNDAKIQSSNFVKTIW